MLIESRSAPRPRLLERRDTGRRRCAKGSEHIATTVGCRGSHLTIWAVDRARFRGLRRRSGRHVDQWAQPRRFSFGANKGAARNTLCTRTAHATSPTASNRYGFDPILQRQADLRSLGRVLPRQTAGADEARSEPSLTDLGCNCARVIRHLSFCHAKESQPDDLLFQEKDGVKSQKWRWALDGQFCRHHSRQSVQGI